MEMAIFKRMGNGSLFLRPAKMRACTERSISVVRKFVDTQQIRVLSFFNKRIYRAYRAQVGVGGKYRIKKEKRENVLIETSRL